MTEDEDRRERHALWEKEKTLRAAERIATGALVTSIPAVVGDLLAMTRDAEEEVVRLRRRVASLPTARAYDQACRVKEVLRTELEQARAELAALQVREHMLLAEVEHARETAQIAADDELLDLAQKISRKMADEREYAETDPPTQVDRWAHLRGNACPHGLIRGLMTCPVCEPEKQAAAEESARRAMAGEDACLCGRRSEKHAWSDRHQEPETSARRWTGRDARKEPASVPHYIQGFFHGETPDRDFTNDIVFRRVRLQGHRGKNWLATTQTGGDGHMYSWADLLAKGAEGSFDYLQEVPEREGFRRTCLVPEETT